MRSLGMRSIGRDLWILFLLLILPIIVLLGLRHEKVDTVTINGVQFEEVVIVPHRSEIWYTWDGIRYTIVYGIGDGNLFVRWRTLEQNHNSLAGVQEKKLWNRYFEVDYSGHLTRIKRRPT